jgi:hypothetical protein
VAAAALSLLLGLALPGCSPTSGAGAGASGQALNRHDEAARLISALEMSERLRNAARDYVVVQMAEGMGPRPALERWVLTEREKGATIRCKPDAGAECVAPK